MRTKTKHLAAVIGDIIGSSRYSSVDRAAIQKHLIRSWEVVQKSHKEKLHSRLEFRVTAGDEFEYVCSDAATALDITTTLRLHLKAGSFKPPVIFRAAIATGERSVSGSANPYTQDGPAFHLARSSMEWLKSQSEYLTFIAHPASPAAIHLVNEILPLLDYHYRNWTPAQCEAVLLARRDLTGEHIAQKLGVSSSAVSQRLGGTNWEACFRAITVLQRLLCEEIKVKDLNLPN
ncbi:MAG: SatD family protein [bacterium]|nr:SatD family protein [bacterium]